MERTKTNKEEGTIRWKKIGLGSHRFGNRIIKPGQVFSARPDQISESMRNFIIPVDELPEEEVIESVPSAYKIQERENAKGYFDVVDGNGKVISEKALRRDAALKFIKDLA